MVKSHGAAFEIIGLWGLVETFVARAAVPAAPQAGVLKLHGGVWGAELHSTLRCEEILKTAFLFHCTARTVGVCSRTKVYIPGKEEKKLRC